MGKKLARIATSTLLGASLVLFVCVSAAAASQEKADGGHGSASKQPAAQKAATKNGQPSAKHDQAENSQGAHGSEKDATAEKPAQKKPAEKPAKKPAQKKSAEKPAEKPAQKKSAEKPAKKPAQKKSAEKPAKKPAQKKSAEKPAKKPAQKKPAEKPFDYARLIKRAKKLASDSYKAPEKIPDFLAKLSPREQAQITFRSDAALWRGQGRRFEAMFYHPGSFYDHAVSVDVVAGGKSRTVKFSKNDFNYPDQKLKKKVPDDLGFAGVKILYPVKNPDRYDEVLSFLGASYFRALGAGEQYGLSARGLAIDTGDMKNGEEFPAFTHFWLMTPDPHARRMTIYALLNSPSVTGAYKFVLTPGDATHVHVEETLFTRKAIAKIGIAPLTSMFTWGENSLARLAKYRPEAHDSDGMLIWSSDGEWLWRPLVNPTRLRINDFQANHVRGFGLSQRDRKFADYQDLKLQYRKRPNAWIMPDGDWGEGHVELVQIPSDSEINDNIVLYWVPKKPVEAGQELHYAYDIKWSTDMALPDTMGHVAATRVGLVAAKPGPDKDRVRMAVDFVGGQLPELTGNQSVQAKLSAGRDVKLHDIEVIRNPETRGWRLLFSVAKSDLSKPLELRAYLTDMNGNSLTETWSYELALP